MGAHFWGAEMPRLRIHAQLGPGGVKAIVMVDATATIAELMAVAGPRLAAVKGGSAGQTINLGEATIEGSMLLPGDSVGDVLRDGDTITFGEAAAGESFPPAVCSAAQCPCLRQKNVPGATFPLRAFIPA